MQSQPLSSNDQGKILVFILLMIPSLIFMVSIIPAIILGFGVYMMKKTQDFSHIDTAVRNFNIATLVSASVMLTLGLSLGAKDKAYIFFVGIPLLTLPITHFLFYVPLRKQSEWVASNGIFSTKRKTVEKNAAIDTPIHESHGELKSVADELLKWSKLKEDGHISDDEFNQAKTKLLKGLLK